VTDAADPHPVSQVQASNTVSALALALTCLSDTARALGLLKDISSVRSTGRMWQQRRRRG
jgi:hypothetical protein